MLCGVTATLGSNPSATATAARPHWGRAVLLCLDGVCTGAGLLDVPVGGGQPASRPREPWHRSLAFRTVGRPPHWWVFRLKCRSGSPAMSHVIPSRLLQTLNRGRWNCNVYGLSRKVTELNYVRLLERWLPPPLSGPSTGCGHRCQATPLHRPALQHLQGCDRGGAPKGPASAACV